MCSLSAYRIHFSPTECGNAVNEAETEERVSRHPQNTWGPSGYGFENKTPSKRAKKTDEHNVIGYLGRFCRLQASVTFHWWPFLSGTFPDSKLRFLVLLPIGLIFIFRSTLIFIRCYPNYLFITFILLEYIS